MIGKKGDSSLVIFVMVVIIVFLMFIYSILVSPLIEPWWAQQKGKGELAQAEQNRQIAVLEAVAKKESALQLAQAEVERAKGVAEANRIIAASINEQYLKYLYIQTLDGQDNKVIYIPTNGLLPVFDVSSASGVK